MLKKVILYFNSIKKLVDKISGKNFDIILENVLLWKTMKRKM